ncbi:MAG TPA: M14 family metallopeptidase [Vicinamibacterales bacterium]|nr:M14 family metallopeptidase [Vicinamibacterales bacterium]
MSAQEPPLWPGAKYDAGIPTLKQVLGHDHGEVITPPEGVAQYLQALQKAAPTRTRLVEYARSWEGRPLWLFVIGSPDRIAKLEQVKTDLQRFADPRRTSAAEADRLLGQLPVVVWLIHGVHGNEISSADAALAEAYHLLASQGDAGVDAVLRDALVLIDPMQNPDGRARFVFQNLLGRAASADPAPYSAEHDEPWPGGRSNHYLFDMNRDWFAQSQPETRGRIRIGLEYVPQITVDLHEQGGDNAYYFAPPADPLNPHITKSQIAAWDLLGRANGARFDERGWPYYIREVYDAFYPGYGDSWPTFQGSIGMTYEQASARGLAFSRSDGDTLTYRDGVMHHFNAAVTTAITAARNRERFLRDYLEYRRSAVAEGEKGPIREYLIVPGQDLSRADLLAKNLATQGIEVRRAEEPIKLASRTLPAGTYIVSNAQPTARMIRNLLDPRTDQPAEFIRKQEERRKMRLNDQIYDITAWNLPMLFDVELVTSSSAITVKAAQVPSQYDAPPPAKPLAAAKVGYLMPWGSATAALSADALRSGLRLRSIGGAFTHNGRRFPIGTAFIRNTENPADLNTRLAALAAKHGAEVVPIDSTWVDEGTSLGSNDVQALKAPKVLLVWDTPTATLSAGWTRYVLERRFGQAVTAVRTSSLGRADFSDYDVMVMPSGNFAGTINDGVLNRIKDWLRAGGTLVTIAEASRWATGSNVGLLDTQTLLKDGRPDVPPPSGGSGGSGAGSGGNNAPKPAEFDYDKAIQPDRERPASQPGAILRVTLDTNHWLTAGNDAEGQVMIEGNRVFAPIKLNSGRNVGVYAAKDKLIASGLIWPDAQDILVQKAFLMHQPFGQGHVIAFAEEPNYRAFTEATMLLFMNAVLLGPGY